MNTKTYTFYTDPGHGWLKVSRAELEALGLADKISSYSYQYKEWVYLEEDCDFGLFFHAKGWDQQPNADFWKSGTIKQQNAAHKYSKIRSYARYTNSPYVKPKIGDIVALINCVISSAKLIDKNRIQTREGITYRVKPSMIGTALTDWT